MIVEFGRVHRGVVWHVLSPVGGMDVAGSYSDAPVCAHGEGEAIPPVTEVTQGHPPRGGRVCPRCADAVNDMVTAIARAGGQP